MKYFLFFGYVVGYIMAVVPPIFLDPILSTHVRYGPRNYPLAPFTVLILALLGVAEVIVLRRAKRPHQLYWSLLPYGFAFILTLPIFLPEMPHGNVAGVSLTLLGISAIAIFVTSVSENVGLDNSKLRPGDGDQREYLKEALSASKQLTFGLLAGYVGVIISWYAVAIQYLKGIVTEPGELFLLSSNASLQFGLMSVYYFVGPLNCSFQMTKRLLEQMKRIAQQADPADKK
jgi:hypothetical protein